MSYNYGNQPPQGQQPRPYFPSGSTPSANPMQQQRPQAYAPNPSAVIQQSTRSPVGQLPQYSQPQQYSQVPTNQPVSNDPRTNPGWNQQFSGQAGVSNVHGGQNIGVAPQSQASSSGQGPARYGPPSIAVPVASNQPSGAPVSQYSPSPQQYAPQASMTGAANPMAGQSYRGPAAAPNPTPYTATTPYTASQPAQYGQYTNPTAQQQPVTTTQYPPSSAPRGAPSASTAYDPFAEGPQSRQPYANQPAAATTQPSYVNQAQPYSRYPAPAAAPQAQPQAQPVPRYGANPTYPSSTPSYGISDSANMTSSSAYNQTVPPMQSKQPEHAYNDRYSSASVDKYQQQSTPYYGASAPSSQGGYNKYGSQSSSAPANQNYQNPTQQSAPSWQQGRSDTGHVSSSATVNKYGPSAVPATDTYSSRSAASSTHQSYKAQPMIAVPQPHQIAATPAAQPVLSIAVPSLSSLAAASNVPIRSQYNAPSSTVARNTSSYGSSSSRQSSTVSSSKYSSRSPPPTTTAVRNTYVVTDTDRRGTRDTKGSRPSHASRGRSRSRSISKTRESNLSGNKRRSRSPIRSTATSTKPASSQSRKIDYSTTPLSQLAKDHHFPAVGRSNSYLRVQDLMTRFPDLYIPADFIKINMEWDAITTASLVGTLNHIADNASCQFESNPAPLPMDSTYPPYVPLLTPPKFTFSNPPEPITNQYLSTATMILSDTNPRILDFIHPVEANLKPIKFNARVIISLGFRERHDKMDHTASRKLRVLIGKKKSNLMLLGGSWCKELDHGDPLQDRSCLESTARRSVLAQSLLDICDPKYCSLVKLCEIMYHRPKEELHGKEYPEQDEITAVFLCTVHTPTEFDTSMLDEDFDSKWEAYSKRCDGTAIGPTMDLVDVDGEILRQQAITQDDAPSIVDNQEETVPPSTDDVMSDSIEHNGIESADSSHIDPMKERDEPSEPVDSDSDANIQYHRDSDGSIFVDEESTLGVIINIIRTSCVEEMDDALKSLSREKILREVKTIKGEAWTNVYKPTCGSLPDFLSQHVDIFDTDGTKVILKDDNKIHLISSADYISKKESNSSVQLESSSAEPDMTGSNDNEDENHFSIQVPKLEDISTTTNIAVVRSKPTSPSIFLCPQPIPKDYLNDVQKRNDAITLRILPLSSVLSYSKDDSNERIFEASIAAEVFKSIISVNNANIIADFLLAADAFSHHISDPRIYYALKKLRAAKPVDIENLVDSADMKVRPPSNNEEVHTNEEDEPVAKKAKEGDTGDVTEAELVSGEDIASSSEAMEFEHVAEDVIVAHAKAKVDSLLAVTDKAPDFEMENGEAMMWKSTFISACRWFDTSQDSELRYDQLQMILHSCQRDISRAIMAAIAWNSCKDEKLRYENWI